MAEHAVRDTAAAAPGARPASLTIALLPGGDRFEDFFDRIGVSLETFRREFTGGWLFNYIEALRLVGVRTVLLLTSARVDAAVHFTHEPSGATVWVLPSPRLHQKVRNAQRRYFPESKVLVAGASYLATPLRAVVQVLRRESCDAILCQEYESPRFDTCVLLGQLLRIPVFATFQGASHTATAVERPLRHVSVRRCAGLVIPATDEIVRVQRRYGLRSQKIGRIPNPVEIVRWDASERQVARAQLGIGTATRVVAWHGRVQVRTKGLDILLDAWDRVCAAQRGADILLMLVGSGPNAEILRQRLGSSERVLWIDRYVFDRRQLWSYLSAADVYAIPSRREGFAVAVLEAMACGLPAVASDVPGVADALPRGELDGGVIVSREDAAALADALGRLLDQPERARRLGEVARRRMESEFSIEVIGPRLRAFLFPDGGASR